MESYLETKIKKWFDNKEVMKEFSYQHGFIKNKSIFSAQNRVK